MNTAKKHRRYKNTRAEWICIIVLCAPAILHLLIFWLGSQVESLRMAFSNVNTGEFSMINFKWAYNALFGGADASSMPLLLRNTIIYFFAGIGIVPVCMFFSYLIYRRTIGHTFIRLALYLPGAVCGTMMALLYIKLMESEGPIMQLICQLTGREEPIFFMMEHGVLYIIIFDILVGMGGNLVIWLGGMSRIPYDLIEYGKLEGIKPIREFVSVILPLIWPTFVTMISLQIIGLFGASGSILILTNGNYNTSSLAFWMYLVVLNQSTGEYNNVAALGLIFTILTIPILIVCRWIMNRFGGEVEY